jgi:hypothetical protein
MSDQGPPSSNRIRPQLKTSEIFLITDTAYGYRSYIVEQGISAPVLLKRSLSFSAR